ncbi:hypothetical protein CPB83DRAFT_869339 [Crepidotus variabilis]|uniref:Uncharacterized protein n=1 Tax=Crepidotus variabilis TaxID=179855 RepID=A0A9P6JQI6_9AGAR|nr:hypothetical protein CPB83DRAFT_869339 [Crepidotus variabilis]
MDLGLKDVHVLVTGLWKQGAIVTAQFNSSIRALESLASDTRIQALKCDLTDEQAVMQFFDSAIGSLGPVQILVVNHAIYEPKDIFLWDMSLEQWRGTLDTNLTSSFLSAMMYGLTMSLKNEIVRIAPKARVNTVAPGWVRTPMAEEPLKDPKIAYAALASTPLKKVATPQDIANQIIILASNKVSGHVTGQVLMVEGGMEGRVLNSPEDLGLVL